MVRGKDLLPIVSTIPVNMAGEWRGGRGRQCTMRMLVDVAGKNLEGQMLALPDAKTESFECSETRQTSASFDHAYSYTSTIEPMSVRSCLVAAGRFRPPHGLSSQWVQNSRRCLATAAPSSSPTLPLASIRVLDMTRVLAGV